MNFYKYFYIILYSKLVICKSRHCLFREVIASVVSGDKEKYSKAYLGRENDQYCTWILTKHAWGGAIEVQILAEYFQVQILVVDTKSGRNFLILHFPRYFSQFQGV